MSAEGLILDVTESNVCNRGYGAFTQAPAAAGIKLFVNIAADKGLQADVAYFTGVVASLMAGLNGRLFGKGGNPYWNIPEEIGTCYTTYIPHQEQADPKGNRPKPIGLSCYSLAPNYFLQDPDVNLLTADDPRAMETLALAVKYLGDALDPRVVRWHIAKPHPSHMGYGLSQLLMALVYAGNYSEFQTRLKGLFDVSSKEVGDVYLMQEVFARSGNPNRGNKAHLTYFPVLADYLGSLTRHHRGEVNGFIPDLKVIATE